jgi:predicted dehydrogenase
MMRWGFLGIGRVTPRMVDSLRLVRGHQLHAVAARDAVKLQTWANQHNVEQTTTDFAELIRSDSIDAIYIALPPSFHHPWASAALEAGKIVLCEKATTLNEDQIRSLAELSDRVQVPFYHATAFPFHPRSMAMRDIVRSGQLGKLTRISIACSFSQVLQRGTDYRTDPQLGGGCLLDLGWYCAYTTLWMTGLKPRSIRAFGRKSKENGFWLSAQAIVELEDEVTAVWDCGFDAAGRKWMEISGNDASIVCDDFLRPWDLDKPRFWMHGHDGKARVEMIGQGIKQEVKLFESIVAEPTLLAAEAMQLAIQTHGILSDWERAMEA